MRAASSRRVAAALALAFAAASCAGTEPAAEVPGEHATVGRPGPLASATVAPATPAASPRPPGSPPVSAKAQARAALDDYLEGLASQTFGRALAASGGAARRLALVRLAIAQGNRDRGATTTVALESASFTVATESPARVGFRGRAVLRSTVAGPAGSDTSVREIADPVVERLAGRWAVTTFRWEGKPVVAHDGGAVARAGGVEFRLEGSIAFGEVVGVVVVLVAKGDHRVALESDELRIGSEGAASGFRTLVGGQPGLLFASYPRRDERPSEWRAEVRIDDVVRRIVLRF